MLVLENQFVKAEFLVMGAELKSFKLKKSDREIMWDANPEYWAKTSPILFPIIGRLKDDAYIYAGKSYSLEKHGFARNKEFQLVKSTADEIQFRLKADAKTLQQYPFDFELLVVYKLQGEKLTCLYEVINNGYQTMFFSLGGHPAFAIGNESTSYSTYKLIFNKDTELKRFAVTEEGFIDMNSYYFSLVNSAISLTHELFYQDALVFRDYKSNQLKIQSDKVNEGLIFEFNDFPYLGIWAAKDANFVCLEPWCGLADAEDHNQILENKTGIVSLSPAEKFSRSWSVIPF